MKRSLVIAIVFLCAVFTAVQAQNTALRIDPGSGNVSIGQTTADEKLVVNGNIKAIGNLIAVNLSAAGNVSVTGNITVTGTLTTTGEIKTNARVKDKTGFVMPVGTVLAYAGAAVPEGWILCDGRSLDRNDPQYTDLFAAVGTAWGAPDANSFNVPDLRGMFLRGVDGTANRDPDKAGRTAIKTGGNNGNSVGSLQADELESHSHPVQANFGASEIYQPNSSLQIWSQTRLSVATLPNGLATAVGGAETRPKNVYVTYIIKY